MSEPVEQPTPATGAVLQQDVPAGSDETAESGKTLEGRTRTQAYLFVGLLFFLTNFAAPHLGLVDVPVSFS